MPTDTDKIVAAILASQSAVARGRKSAESFVEIYREILSLLEQPDPELKPGKFDTDPSRD